MASWSIGIDIGGTFTDVVAIAQAPGSQHSAKVLTTHDDPTLGVVNAIESLIQATGLHPADVGRVVHATTLFTNALIERRGAATALLTNRGFEDVLAVGNERKYDLYDLSIGRAPALVPSRWRVGVAGRLDAQGNEIATTCTARTESCAYRRLALPSPAPSPAVLTYEPAGLSLRAWPPPHSEPNQLFKLRCQGYVHTHWKAFHPNPNLLTAAKESGGSETKQGLRRNFRGVASWRVRSQKREAPRGAGLWVPSNPG